MQTSHQLTTPGQLGARSLNLSFVQNADDLCAAQRLRYQVFVEEMGAKLGDPGRHLDQDAFDAHCEHLLVRDERSGEVVGTYRILSPEAAQQCGGYYTETEFELERLQPLRPQLVELGRSCVHPDYRSGAVISLLWLGIAGFMLRHGYRYLVGCASVNLADGGVAVASLYRQLRAQHLAPSEWRVVPRNPLPIEQLHSNQQAEVPPLIKGYLRAGAYICGAPAWDAEFNCADLPILLPMARLSQRYARHFLAAA